MHTSNNINDLPGRGESFPFHAKNRAAYPRPAAAPAFYFRHGAHRAPTLAELNLTRPTLQIDNTDDFAWPVGLKKVTTINLNLE